ncbi:hypothetical protein ACJIZ3_022172 [Penstemon smallii]|uniref:Uncharacterized protein n=1 Tax=Penstemon smallii TaxID=265156 RepID=A0ABD3SPA1_9LAMI
MLLELIRQVLPNGETLPKTFYEAKSLLRELGLGYETIHACKYDCVLYWKEFKDCQECPRCATSRWEKNDGKGKKIPHKVLRYFPLKPRLQRLFMSRKTAEDMRWHKKKRMDDETTLKHPADAKAWKDFDKKYSQFASDSRNVRLGLATDGFNPFGSMSNSYSMWPVVLVPYNLPPWECMKEPFFMMSLLIPGPQSPGRDIDVYLQPLVEELKELWSNGVTTYDASCGENFSLRAAVLWTINDFPAYGILSGWSTKGYLACPVCNRYTPSKRLRSKICYMRHRRYLPRAHKWREMADCFDGTNEYGSAPKELFGEDVLQQLNYLKDVEFGKHPNNKKKKNTSEDLNWRKKSILFELPYWHQLRMRHNLDVMHIEKNICDSILGTLLNIEGKSKDTLKARKDLEDLNIRKELHLKKRIDGSYSMPPACYTMSKKEKQKFCEFLKSVKFPDGYASNISRCVNISEGKVSGLKSHDCHVILQRLLPIGIRGCLPNHVTKAIIDLGYFFQRLCCKSLNVKEVKKMKKEIPVILCKLEMIFPPAFFDVMVHLAIHLPREALLGGPVQYRWMFPIERFLSTLKKYVRNKARPEGSIAEAYSINECLTFCSMYLDGIETRFNREERNHDIVEDGGLSVFSQKLRPLGAPEYVEVKQNEIDIAHAYVLNNCEELEPYFQEHIEELKQESILSVEERHKEQFPLWFRRHMIKLRHHNSPKATDALYALACGPDICIKKYTGYIVNGIRFHTIDRGSHLKSQNSGVVVEANHGDSIIDFYGVLSDILELDYIKDKRVVIFKCEWFNVGDKKIGIQKDDKITSINFDAKWYQDDPFVLACQAKQVFYVRDTKLGKNWRVVQKFQHRHVFSRMEMQNQIDNSNEIAIMNDFVYQESEPIVDANTVQDEEQPLLLYRNDVEPIVLDSHTLQHNTRLDDKELYEEDECDEDDTIVEYLCEEDLVDLIDEDSDLDPNE